MNDSLSIYWSPRIRLHNGDGHRWILKLYKYDKLRNYFNHSNQARSRILSQGFFPSESLKSKPGARSPEPASQSSSRNLQIFNNWKILSFWSRIFENTSSRLYFWILMKHLKLGDFWRGSKKCATRTCRLKEILSGLKANVSIQRVWIPDSIYARVRPAFTSCQIRGKIRR